MHTLVTLFFIGSSFSIQPAAYVLEESETCGPTWQYVGRYDRLQPTYVWLYDDCTGTRPTIVYDVIA